MAVPVIETEADQLKQAVERMHYCSARAVQSIPVSMTHEGALVWEGVVHVFELSGHLKAKAYAWSSQIDASDKRRVFVVLHLPPVTSPLAAVRAAIGGEHREPL
jgi:hypothetical protein